MTSMTPVKDEIRAFILRKYLPGESPANVRDETPLFSSGILDSLGSLELVAFLEQQFGIEITAAERSLENLDRIEDIATLITLKRDNSLRLT